MQTKKLAGESIEEQTQQALRNLRAVVEAAGSSMDKVCKVTVLLKDMGDYRAVNEIYATYFPSEAPPARAAFQVANLPANGARAAAGRMRASEQSPLRCCRPSQLSWRSRRSHGCEEVRKAGIVPQHHLSLFPAHTPWQPPYPARHIRSAIGAGPPAVTSTSTAALAPSSLTGHGPRMFCGGPSRPSLDSGEGGCVEHSRAHGARVCAVRALDRVLLLCTQHRARLAGTDTSPRNAL